MKEKRQKKTGQKRRQEKPPSVEGKRKKERRKRKKGEEYCFQWMKRREKKASLCGSLGSSSAVCDMNRKKRTEEGQNLNILLSSQKKDKNRTTRRTGTGRNGTDVSDFWVREENNGQMYYYSSAWMSVSRHGWCLGRLETICIGFSEQMNRQGSFSLEKSFLTREKGQDRKRPFI